MKSNPNISRKIILSKDESVSLACALEFLLNYDVSSDSSPAFDWKAASSAIDKIESKESVFSQSEVIACAFAIDFSIKCMLYDPVAISLIEQEYPDLIPDLEDALPALKELRPRYQGYVTEFQ